MTKKQYLDLIDYLKAFEDLSVRSSINVNSDECDVDYAQIIIGIEIKKDKVK